MSEFDFEEEKIKEAILKLNARSVLLQFPSGFRPAATRIAKFIAQLGVLPIISADPCYGACDLAINEALNLHVDLLIHFGHSKFLNHMPFPTLYVETKAKVDVDDVIFKSLPFLEKWSKIGLVTTIQHTSKIARVKELLQNSGKTVKISNYEFLRPGQVLGCNYINAKLIAKDVEAFLFVGGGKFHALGVALSTSKPTIVANPFVNDVYSVNEEVNIVIKQRWLLINQARKAKNFGVLLSLKFGQKKFDTALELKEKIEKKGKNSFLFIAKELYPEHLMDFSNIDCYVNTACPRISIEDHLRFKKPLLTINEVLVVIGDLSWENLCKKGFFED